MSKYLVDKFLYTVDRDPDLVEHYREDPRGTVAWWDLGVVAAWGVAAAVVAVRRFDWEPATQR